MNLEEIKVEWKQFHRKLESSQRLNEQLLESMLRERSRSRLSKIRRDNILYLLLMLANLVFLAGIFLGNPFDFKYTVQYLPFVLLAVGVLMAVGSIVISLQRVNVNINDVNLDIFLKTTIDAFEKKKKVESWFGLIIFSAGTLTAFSFLPKKLEQKSLPSALGETALSIIITLAIYFIAYKLGAFKNRKKEGFENDYKELNELKALAADLNNK
jgi:hypothetical protein